MGRFVNVVANRLDVVVYIRIHILFTLLVVHPPLYDVEEMRNYSTGSTALPQVIEIKAPWVG